MKVDSASLQGTPVRAVRFLVLRVAGGLLAGFALGGAAAACLNLAVCGGQGAPWQCSPVALAILISVPALAGLLAGAAFAFAALIEAVAARIGAMLGQLVWKVDQRLGAPDTAALIATIRLTIKSLLEFAIRLVEFPPLVQKIGARIAARALPRILAQVEEANTETPGNKLRQILALFLEKTVCGAARRTVLALRISGWAVITLTAALLVVMLVPPLLNK